MDTGIELAEGTPAGAAADPVRAVLVREPRRVEATVPTTGIGTGDDGAEGAKGPKRVEGAKEPKAEPIRDGELVAVSEPSTWFSVLFRAPNTIGTRPNCSELLVKVETGLSTLGGFAGTAGTIAGAAAEPNRVGLVRDPATEDTIEFAKDVGTGAEGTGGFTAPNRDGELVPDSELKT